jgi:hypothetical protein
MLINVSLGRDRGRRGLGRTLVLASALIVVGVLLAGAIPSLNPFGTETKDRSGPAVLKSIEKLSEYRAATANLEVIVDVEKDDKILPSFLKGTRTLLVAAGKVDASVNFGALRGDAITVSKDRKSVTIVLPEPKLTPPQLNLDRTRVFDRDRGLIDRVEGVFQDDPTSEKELLQLAERKLTAAALEDRGVLKAAQTNTRAMLTGLLLGLGFERVTVKFGAPARAQPRD